MGAPVGSGPSPCPVLAAASMPQARPGWQSVSTERSPKATPQWPWAIAASALALATGNPKVKIQSLAGPLMQVASPNPRTYARSDPRRAFEKNYPHAPTCAHQVPIWQPPSLMQVSYQRILSHGLAWKQSVMEAISVLNKVAATSPAHSGITAQWRPCLILTRNHAKAIQDAMLHAASC